MSFGPAPGTLGQTVQCMGNWAVGGAVTWAADGSSATVIPDDNPGSPVTLRPMPGGGSLSSLYATFKTRPRVAFSGFLLTNRTLLSDGGAGSLGANEFYRTNQRGDVCPSTVLALYPAYTPAAPGPSAPPPPPPFTGTQEATVNVVGGGVPANVTVYAADGLSYKLAASSDPTNAAELATTAPQGPALKITGRWDPAAGEVSVTNWYIVATGDKKYGVEPGTGEVVPQRPGIPSTDWPGVPAEYPQEPTGSGAPGGGGGEPGGASPPSPASAGLGWGLGLLVAVFALSAVRGGRR